MAKSSTVTIVVQVVGDGSTNTTTLQAGTNTAAPSSGTYPVMVLNPEASGTVPPGSTGVIIIPPAGNATSITINGAAGDTGVPINPAAPFWLPLPPGATQFGLTLGAVLTLGLQFT